MRVSDILNSSSVTPQPERPSMLVVLHTKPLSRVTSSSEDWPDTHRSPCGSWEDIGKDIPPGVQYGPHVPEPDVISLSPDPSDLTDEPPQTPSPQQTPSGTPSPSTLEPFPVADFLQIGPTIVFYKPTSTIVRSMPDHFKIIDPFAVNQPNFKALLFPEYNSFLKRKLWSDFYKVHQERGDANYTLWKADPSLLSFVQPRLLAICMGCEKACFRVFEGVINGLEGHQEVCSGTGHGHYFVKGVMMNHRSPMSYMVFEEDSLDGLPVYRRGYIDPESTKTSMPLIDELDLVFSQGSGDAEHSFKPATNATTWFEPLEETAPPSSPLDARSPTLFDDDEELGSPFPDNETTSSSNTDSSFIKSIGNSASFTEIGRSLYQHKDTKLIFSFDSMRHTVKVINPITLKNPSWLKRKLNEGYQHIEHDESSWSSSCYELIDPIEKNFCIVQADEDMVTLLPWVTVSICHGCMKKCFTGNESQRWKAFKSHLRTSTGCLTKAFMSEHKAISVDQTPVTYVILDSSETREHTPATVTGSTRPESASLDILHTPTKTAPSVNLLSQTMNDIIKAVKSAHSYIQDEDHIMRPDVHGFLKGPSPTTHFLLQTMLLEYLTDEIFQSKDAAKQIKFKFAPQTGRLLLTTSSKSMEIQLLLQHERQTDVHSFRLSLTIVGDENGSVDDAEQIEAEGLYLKDVCSLFTLIRIVIQVFCKKNSKAIILSKCDLKDLIFDALESVEIDPEIMVLLFRRYIASRLSNH